MNSNLFSTARVGAMVLVAATFSLVACDRPDEPTVGQKVDAVISETKQVSADAAKSMNQTAEAVKTGASDATITTKINAALAVDDKLSALKIDVDTVNGHVTLSGTVPDRVSRERATSLASAVDGVTAVDNRLTVNNGQS